MSMDSEQKNVALYFAIGLVIAFIMTIIVAVKIGAEVTIFEPTQADFDNPTTRAQIHEQQAVYVTHKKSGSYENAYANSLFYFQRAWLSYNRADYLLRSKPLTKEIVEQAIALIKDALENCKQKSAVETERYWSEQMKVKKHADWKFRYAIGRLEEF